MSPQDRPAAVLSTIVVAGLAVGIGFGVHAMIGETDISPSAGPSTSEVVLSGDICVLMDDMVDFTDGMSETSISADRLFDENAGSDPALLDAIHANGQATLDNVGHLTSYLSNAAELATDPDAAAAFETLVRVYEAQVAVFGRMALEAESVESYVTALLSAAGDAEINALVSEGDAAASVAARYVFETCGRDILGSNTTTESVVKADVSTLGMQFATYYVDWDGHTQPEVTVSGDEYYLNGMSIGTQAPGVTLTDQYANGPADWCVEVTSEEDPPVVYTYTAQAGLARGTCSSSRP